MEFQLSVDATTDRVQLYTSADFAALGCERVDKRNVDTNKRKVICPVQVKESLPAHAYNQCVRNCYRLQKVLVQCVMQIDRYAGPPERA